MNPNTIDDLAATLMIFNGRFPRPGIAPLYLSEPCGLDEKWADEYWPYATLPGVYVVYDAHNRLIYIGKASLDATLGGRLGTHFMTGSGRPAQGPPGWEDAKYVRTIPLPRHHAFEAPAIEEYLLKRLCTRQNKQGQTKNDIQPDDPADAAWPRR